MKHAVGSAARVKEWTKAQGYNFDEMIWLFEKGDQ
jgi:hypothetical protein